MNALEILDLKEDATFWQCPCDALNLRTDAECWKCGVVSLPTAVMGWEVGWFLTDPQVENV